MIVGVDFGAPRRERDQRRKIVAVAAQALGGRSYRVDGSGMNARLWADAAPGWSARELVDVLLAQPARVVGFDFPFGVPHALLCEPRFAADVGHDDGAFLGWRAFNAWVAQRLPFTDPLDFTPFAAWRAPHERARLWARRATDVAASAQPPLKDLFQSTFQMTLLGNAVLARLWESRRYRVLPFPGGDGEGEVIEVYPGATLRRMGLVGYKVRPGEALRVVVAVCAAAGIHVEIDARILALACRYDSGSSRATDYDVADALVALCTAILHAEGACLPVVAPDPVGDQPDLRSAEGAIWVPVARFCGDRLR